MSNITEFLKKNIGILTAGYFQTGSKDNYIVEFDAPKTPEEFETLQVLATLLENQVKNESAVVRLVHYTKTEAELDKKGYTANPEAQPKVGSVILKVDNEAFDILQKQGITFSNEELKRHNIAEIGEFGKSMSLKELMGITQQRRESFQTVNSFFDL